MNARALVSWSRPQFDRMHRAVEQTLAAWASDWMPIQRSDAARLSVGEFTPADCGPLVRGAKPWKRLAQRGDAALWCSDADALDGAVQTLLFGHALAPDRRDSVSGRIAAQARDDLLRAWAGAAGLAVAAAPPDAPSDTPPPHLLQRWSGAAVARIDIADASIALLASADGARALAGAADAASPPRGAPASAPLASLRDALAASTIRVRAELRPTELDLGALLQMASGDVIRLSHALNDPLIVSTDAQADFCAGHLVQRTGRLAIELAPRVTP